MCQLLRIRGVTFSIVTSHCIAGADVPSQVQVVFRIIITAQQTPRRCDKAWQPDAFSSPTTTQGTHECSLLPCGCDKPSQGERRQRKGSAFSSLPWKPRSPSGHGFHGQGICSSSSFLGSAPTPKRSPESRD